MSLSYCRTMFGWCRWWRVHVFNHEGGERLRNNSERVEESGGKKNQSTAFPIML